MSNFLPWVTNASNIMSFETFRDLSERKTGFIAGTKARGDYVNAALTQANLVVVALANSMNLVGDLQSSVTVIQDGITNFFNKFALNSDLLLATSRLNSLELNSATKTELSNLRQGIRYFHSYTIVYLCQDHEAFMRVSVSFMSSYSKILTSLQSLKLANNSARIPCFGKVYVEYDRKEYDAIYIDASGTRPRVFYLTDDINVGSNTASIELTSEGQFYGQVTQAV